MVRVHCSIRIASAALLFYVAADSHSPRESDDETAAIVEVVVVEVRSRSIVAAVQVVGESAVRIGFHLVATLPILSESESEALAEVAAPRNIFHRHLVFASIEITDVLRRTERRIHVEAPMFLAVQSRIEIVVGRSPPVAVHIHWHRHSATRHLVVFRTVRSAVPRSIELEVDSICALVVDNCPAILELNILGETRLQFRVTYTYIKRVCIAQRIGNHVRNVGPTRIGIVSELQLFLTAEPVLEVHYRRGVDDSPSEQSVYAALVIVDLTDLRLHISADGQTIFRAVDAYLKSQVVVLTNVLGVTALLLVLNHILRIEEVVVVILVHTQDVVVRVEDRTHIPVVVAEVVAIVVGQLQESLIGDGLAVTETRIEVVAVVRATIILHFMIDRVFAAECLQQIVIRLRIAVSVVVRIAITATQIQRNVSSGLLQSLVDLQRSRGVDVLRTAPVVAQTVVHTDLLCQSSIVGQWSGGELEGVVVPSGRFIATFTMTSAETELRSEHNVPSRVGLPFHSVLETEVAVVVAAMVLVCRIGRVLQLEVLRVRLRSAAVLTEIAIHTTVQLQHFVLPVHRGSQPLIVAQTVALSVVRTSHKAVFFVTSEAVDVQVSAVSVVSAVSPVGSAKQTFLPVLLDSEVEHSPLVPVVNTCDSSHVALAVVSLHLIHDFGRQVLEHQIPVVAEELLAVHQNLTDVLAVESVVAVLVLNNSRQLLDEVFHHRTLGQFEGIRVIGHRIVYHRHFWQFALHNGFGHNRSILSHHHIRNLVVARLLRQDEFELLRLEAHERNLKGIGGSRNSGQDELSVLLSGGAGNHRVALVIELHSRPFHGVQLLVLVDSTADIKKHRLLLLGLNQGGSKQEQKAGNVSYFFTHHTIYDAPTRKRFKKAANLAAFFILL